MADVDSLWEQLDEHTIIVAKRRIEAWLVEHDRARDDEITRLVSLGNLLASRLRQLDECVREADATASVSFIDPCWLEGDQSAIDAWRKEARSDG